MTTETRPAFTPGPWRVWYADGFGHEVPEDKMDFLRVQIGDNAFAVGWERPHDDDFANARLIAAAPEMYEALGRMLTDACLDDDDPCHCEADRDAHRLARAALAKANGR